MARRFVFFERVKDFWDKLPPSLRNKYSVTTAIFVVWMLFFDQHSVMSQYRLQKTFEELKNKKVYFEEEIEQANIDQRDLLTDQNTVEKFAREHYLMKKKDENIYVFVEEEE